jgi:hypothetical protein
MIMRAVQYMIATCLLVMAWPAQSLAMGSNNPAAMISVTGIIRVKGSAPLTRVVLVPQGEDPDRVTKDKVYLVTGDLAKELMERDQNRSVTLMGPLCTSQPPEYVKCIAPVEVLRSGR